MSIHNNPAPVQTQPGVQAPALPPRPTTQAPTTFPLARTATVFDSATHGTTESTPVSLTAPGKVTKENEFSKPGMKDKIKLYGPPILLGLGILVAIGLMASGFGGPAGIALFAGVVLLALTAGGGTLLTMKNYQEYKLKEDRYEGQELAKTIAADKEALFNLKTSPNTGGSVKQNLISQLEEKIKTDEARLARINARIRSAEGPGTSRQSASTPATPSSSAPSSPASPTPTSTTPTSPTLSAEDDRSADQTQAQATSPQPAPAPQSSAPPLPPRARAKPLPTPPTADSPNPHTHSQATHKPNE